MLPLFLCPASQGQCLGHFGRDGARGLLPAQSWPRTQRHLLLPLQPGPGQDLCLSEGAAGSGHPQVGFCPLFY